MEHPFVVVEREQKTQNSDLDGGQLWWPYLIRQFVVAILDVSHYQK